MLLFINFNCEYFKIIVLFLGCVCFVFLKLIIFVIRLDEIVNICVIKEWVVRKNVIVRK